MIVAGHLVFEKDTDLGCRDSHGLSRYDIDLFRISGSGSGATTLTSDTTEDCHPLGCR